MKFKVKPDARNELGAYAARAIEANEVIAKIKFVREVTAGKPRTAGEPFIHQLYAPDGRVFLVAEPYCYFNHSCEANAWLYSVNKQYYVSAKRDIKEDEEITIDYELGAVSEDIWVNECGGDPTLRMPENGVVGDEWKCECGAENCRDFHKWNFFTLPHKVILESLPYLDPWFVEVHGERISEILDENVKTETE